MDLKTGKRHMIHSGRILNADISPDGQWFVFHSFSLPQYMYKMRSDGTDLQKLTGPDSPNPDWEYTVMGEWSHSGSKILFAVYAGIPRGVSLMDSDGTNPHIIIPLGIEPRWSPDGSPIIYINWDTTLTPGEQRQIYIADSSGNNAKRITKLNHSHNLDDPGVSPDGNQIVFTSLGQDHDPEMFIMNIDGGNIKQVTEASGYVRRPEWSPDGKTILFSRIINNVSSRLYFLNVTTRQVTPVFPANKP